MNSLLSDAGGQVFTFALFVLNSCFLLWDKLRIRVNFYESEAKSTVSQACANVMDISAKAKEESDNLLRSVNLWFRCLRKSCVALIQLATVASVVILYLGWSGKETFLLLLPLSLYSILSWIWFRRYLNKSNALCASFPAPAQPVENSIDVATDALTPEEDDACPLQSELIRMSKHLEAPGKQGNAGI